MKKFSMRNFTVERIGDLNALISEAEGRATERTISALGIQSALADVEERLDIPKKAMQGIVCYIDINAQTFPSAYKYIPKSTWFQAEYKSGSWTILDIWRGKTAGATLGHRVILTDEAEKAILKRCKEW